MCANSRCRGLYRSLLRDGSLVRWFKLVGFEVLIGEIPFLLDQILVSRKFGYYIMSISHDKVPGPETRHIPINFRLSRSLDGASYSDKTTPV